MKLLALLWCLGAFAAPRTQITIGYNPPDRRPMLEANSRRLSDYVKQKTGLAVHSFVAKDYDSLVRALAKGEIDFAFLPPLSYVQAEEKAGAKLLLKAVRKGQALYFSAVIVRADSGLKKIDDLKGKTMAWVNESSSTGYLMPRAEMARKKLGPQGFFKQELFLGTHDAVVNAVFKKTADAGAVWTNDFEGKDGAWQRYLKDPDEAAQIKMILAAGPTPGEALATTNALWRKERPMVEKVEVVLRRMGEALDGQQILRDLYGIDQMVPATPKDYEPVRAALKLLPAAKH